ncbi:MAG: hypothetical protein ACP5JT_06185, partial [Thermoplasmata archaeon]
MPVKHINIKIPNFPNNASTNFYGILYNSYYYYGLSYNITFPVYTLIQNQIFSMDTYMYYYLLANGTFPKWDYSLIYTYNINLQITGYNLTIFGIAENSINITIIVNGLPSGVSAPIYVFMNNNYYNLLSAFTLNASSTDNVLTFQVMLFSSIEINVFNVSFNGYDIIPQQNIYKYDNIIHPLLIVINYTTPFLNNSLQNQNSQYQN